MRLVAVCPPTRHPPRRRRRHVGCSPPLTLCRAPYARHPMRCAPALHRPAAHIAAKYPVGYARPERSRPCACLRDPPAAASAATMMRTWSAVQAPPTAPCAKPCGLAPECRRPLRASAASAARRIMALIMRSFARRLAHTCGFPARPALKQNVVLFPWRSRPCAGGSLHSHAGPYRRRLRHVAGERVAAAPHNPGHGLRQFLPVLVLGRWVMPPAAHAAAPPLPPQPLRAGQPPPRRAPRALCGRISFSATLKRCRVSRPA